MKFLAVMARKRDKCSSRFEEAEKKPIIFIDTTVGSATASKKYCMTCGVEIFGNKEHTEDECLVAQIHEVSDLDDAAD